MVYRSKQGVVLDCGCSVAVTVVENDDYYGTYASEGSMRKPCSLHEGTKEK